MPTPGSPVASRALCALALGLFVALPAAVYADEAPTCMSLVTTDAVKAATGLSLEDMGGSMRGEGESECAWMARGGSAGFVSLSVQFYDLTAIAGSPSAPEAAAFFDQVVSFAIDAAGGAAEPLEGIGVRASFVPTDPQVLMVVQRADGVARLVGNNLTREQMTAVARIVGGS